MECYPQCPGLCRKRNRTDMLIGVQEPGDSSRKECTNAEDFGDLPSLRPSSSEHALRQGLSKELVIQHVLDSFDFGSTVLAQPTNWKPGDAWHSGSLGFGGSTVPRARFPLSSSSGAERSDCGRRLKHVWSFPLELELTYTQNNEDVRGWSAIILTNGPNT